ncbi:WhiB family transcriptional regulator [Streptomyces bacillaris]|uniref:WhiB family transcriptional regulator n=1 Tax=Streptomyces bacillaris TaxID=68179 RepID=UPI003667BBF3
MTSRDWELEAVCRTTDPEVFFPTASESSKPAMDICWRCPVRTACLEAAMAEEHPDNRRHSGRHGIRGGYTANARGELQKRRDLTANRAATPTTTN